MFLHGDHPRAPGASALAVRPTLLSVDDFIDEAAAAEILALFGDEAWVSEHALHYGWGAEGFVAEVPASAAPLLGALSERLDDITGVRGLGERTFRFRYYGEGQGHPPHTDTYTDASGDVLGLTTLLALLDTAEGGETRFPRAEPAPVEVAPRLGRLLWWTSTGPGGQDDPHSLHEGAVVKAGCKAVLLSFVYLPPEAHPALPPLEPPWPIAS